MYDDDNIFGDHYAKKPTLGVFNREVYSPRNNRDRSFSSNKQSPISGGGEFIDRSNEPMQKESSAIVNDDVTLPSVVKLENLDYRPGPREMETSLDPSGYKPSPKDIIRARIAKVNKNFSNSIIKEYQDKDEANHKVNMEADTSTFIDRKDVDKPTTFTTKSAAQKNDLMLLESDDISPIKIMVLLSEKWTEEWIDWEPETIIQTASMEGVKISGNSMSKIFAIRSLVKTEEFFKTQRSFEKICLAFNNRVVDWGCVQNVSIAEMNATVAVVERYIKESDFSEEISMYIAGMAADEGFVRMPAYLQFASGDLNYILAIKMGEGAAVELLNGINGALDHPNDEPSPEVAIQFIRLAKCDAKAQDAISLARI